MTRAHVEKSLARGHGLTGPAPLLARRSRALFWTGLGLAVLGVAALGAPHLGHVLIGALAGWVLWFAGGLMLFASLFLIGPRPMVAGVISALVAIAAGAFLLFRPTVGTLTVALLAAGALIVDGAFQAAWALNLRPVAIWRWVLASAFASALAAVVILSGVKELSTELFGMMAGLAVLSTGLVFVGLSQAKSLDR